MFETSLVKMIITVIFFLLQFIHASCQTENIPSTCVWWQAPEQKCSVLFYVSMKLEKSWYVTLMLVLCVCLTSCMNGLLF